MGTTIDGFALTCLITKGTVAWKKTCQHAMSKCLGHPFQHPKHCLQIALGVLFDTVTKRKQQPTSSIVLAANNIKCFSNKSTVTNVVCLSGWWFQPLQKILVSWDDSSQYMEK